MVDPANGHARKLTGGGHVLRAVLMGGRRRSGSDPMLMENCAARPQPALCRSVVAEPNEALVDVRSA